MGTGAFAQETGKALTAQDPLLQGIPSVKELAHKIDAAIVKVEASAKGARAAGKEANDALTALYKDYQAELEKQLKLHASEPGLKAALDKELQSVKEKNTSTSTR